MKAMLDMVKHHKEGNASGIYSVCCSHPIVIEAAMRHALKGNETLLIEATSNQVNQFGGYTGMKPSDYCDLIYTIASKVGFDKQNIILGGDHLGPNCWQDLPHADAMAMSETLIHDYVSAGFKKIHLDCSMSCADDPVPLGDSIVAQRAARLCQVAERAWKETGGEAPVYIIGTEVPIPGGAQEGLDVLLPTSVNDAKQTIEIHHNAFTEAGLEDAWKRIIALVVQPGVEFDHHKIIPFSPSKSKELSEFIEHATFLYEAHSTDYQSQEHLAELVKQHFAILKVGPWLTFAMREACFALEAIEQEWVDYAQRSHLKQTLLDSMHKNPTYFKKYYSSDEKQQLLDCQYSLSDRIRYYWPTPEVESALTTLLNNIDSTAVPLTLISQYLPNQFDAIMAGKLRANAKEMIFHKIGEVLQKYSNACYSNSVALSKDI